MQYDFLKSELSNDTTRESKITGITVFNTENVNYKKQPMFFGKPLGVQRYDSYKYPVFDNVCIGATMDHFHELPDLHTCL